MHHFHKGWWQLAFYRILNMFFDNNFLFFVTVMATLDDSRRKKITYAFLPYGLIAFDSLQDIKIIF